MSSIFQLRQCSYLSVLKAKFRVKLKAKSVILLEPQEALSVLFEPESTGSANKRDSKINGSEQSVESRVFKNMNAR